MRRTFRFLELELKHSVSPVFRRDSEQLDVFDHQVAGEANIFC